MNEHFLTGFIKQAALYNIAEEEALELLKNAGSKLPSMKLPPRKKFKNNVFGDIHHYFSDWGGDSLGYRKALWGTGALLAGAGAADVARYNYSKKRKSEKDKDDSEKKKQAQS